MHAVQRPFVFEPRPCARVHHLSFTHGSVNQKMLTERNKTLCLKCHFKQQTGSGTLLIGGRDHSAFLSRGTCGQPDAMRRCRLTDQSSLRF